MEALIVQNAKARFEITVPAVYWRLDEVAAAPVCLPAQAAPTRHEPIEAEEIVAFKQALLAAASVSVAAQDVAARGGRRCTDDWL